MSSTVYIDFNAKIEQWERDTAVTMANEQQCRTLFFPSSIKQRVRRRIKELHGSKSVQYRFLAVMVYMMVRNSLDTIDCIVIDRDYGGDKVAVTISNLLIALIRRDKPNASMDMIRFEEIRGSTADKRAKLVYNGEIRPDHSPSYDEVVRLFAK